MNANSEPPSWINTDQHMPSSVTHHSEPPCFAMSNSGRRSFQKTCWPTVNDRARASASGDHRVAPCATPDHGSAASGCSVPRGAYTAAGSTTAAEEKPSPPSPSCMLVLLLVQPITWLRAPCQRGSKKSCEQKCAPAGNRTRVESMATIHYTTKPLALECECNE